VKSTAKNCTRRAGEAPFLGGMNKGDASVFLPGRIYNLGTVNRRSDASLMEIGGRAEVCKR